MKKLDSVAIAKLAGVSRSTVSKVINNYPTISSETRDKILRVIEEQGYSPNLSARILAGKKTDTLGFFFFCREKFSGDPLVNLMIATVIESAAQAGFHILTYLVADSTSAATAAKVKEVFHQRRIDAGIILGAQNEDPLVEDLIEEGAILGVFDQNRPDHREPNRIVSNLDDESTASRSIQYLFDQGHRRIGLVNGDLGRHAGAAKDRGYRSALAALGLEVRPEWVLGSEFSDAAGYQAVCDFLAGPCRDRPTAFAAADDSVAFGAIRALNEAGLRVPEDIAIVGIDNHPWAALVRPALTTFSYDFAAVFADLIERVVALVLDPQASVPLVRSFPAVLVERDSCPPIGEAGLFVRKKLE